MSHVMSKALKTVMVGIFTIGVLPFSVQAQYQGPSLGAITHLKTVLDDPIDNKAVVLKGYLINKITHEDYTFSDGEHTIRVEVDDHAFPREPFDENTLIEIHGKVDKDYFKTPEIEVDSILIIPVP